MCLFSLEERLDCCMFLTKETFLILAQRGWQAFAGLVTLIFISNYLSPEQQGWYYTFISIVALYSVFEMGLATAILQVGAHIFVELRWGQRGLVQGANASIFESLSNSSLKVYLKLTLAFVFIVMPIGFYIFSARDSSFISGSWQIPWVAAIITTAISMIVLPFVALVEGSGEIKEVYLVRLLQGFLGAITCWIVIMCGGFLWGVVMMPLASILISVVWLLVYRPRLVSQAWYARKDVQFNWREQVWSLQWRVGVSWIGVYFISQLATPILFFFKDAIVAGQMGFTLTVAHMIGILSQSWITRHVPTMSAAARRSDWNSLDKLFFSDLKYMSAIFFLAACIVLGMYGIFSHTEYINRFLPFWQFLGLLVFVFLFQVNLALSAYLRSFGKEPLMPLITLGAILIVSGTLWAAIHFSSAEVVLTMLLVQGLIILPLSIYVWKKYRGKWCEEGYLR